VGHLVQPVCQSRVTYSRLHRTASRRVLNISREGDPHLHAGMDLQRHTPAQVPAAETTLAKKEPRTTAMPALMSVSTHSPTYRQTFCRSASQTQANPKGRRHGHAGTHLFLTSVYNYPVLFTLGKGLNSLTFPKGNFIQPTHRLRTLGPTT